MHSCGYQGRSQQIYSGQAITYREYRLSAAQPHVMASLLAIGGGCGRGMCPLPPKAEALEILSLAVVFCINFKVFYAL